MQCRATIAYTTTDASLQILDIADGLTRTIRAEGRVWQLSGPDSEGRVIYTEEYKGNVRLMTLGKDEHNPVEVLSRRSKRPFWEMREFQGLVLSPTLGRFAFIHDEPGQEIPWDERPRQIEVWHLNGSLLREHSVSGATHLTWFPDGQRLAFAQEGRSEDMPCMRCDADYEQGKYPVSTVLILDVQTGNVEPLHLGERAIVSPSSTVVLVRVAGYWRILDRGTRECTPLDVPGLMQPLALVSDDLLVYCGLPTTGQEQEKLYTAQAAPQWKWTVKLASIRTHKFVTVLPYVARFHRYSVARTPDNH